MKKLLFVFIITLFSFNISFAQKSDTSEIYRIVQVMPEFTGGEAAMFQYIADNTVYPAEAFNANITGNIYISFIIEKDGSISNVKQAEGSDDIGGGCVEEGIRVVKSMPNWSPGTQRGEAVRVSYVLPICYTLSKRTQRENKKRNKKKAKN